ncbi:hypothetical protein MMC25_000095 [Agyrium rufum]|nr:hypothetical protein [Agyrium rufum]
MRPDPRIRQTLNQISSTIETANINTQASLYTISQSYLAPCLSSLNTCLEASCYPCIGARRENERRRARVRGGRNAQPELSFDFYDDWEDYSEDGETTGLLGGWGNEDLDRLLAGSGTAAGGSDQPKGRQRAMSYGARGGGGRRRRDLPAKEDQLVVPSSNVFGFLERLPWKIGNRGIRYKPSAADLKEHPGRRSSDSDSEGQERQALLEESESEITGAKGHRRQRSDTVESRSTTNSLSSRGDLFPSEDEDDAVPLGDEFAMQLERRNTNTLDDVGTGKTQDKRPAASRASTRTDSSKETRSTKNRRRRADSLPSVKVVSRETDSEERPLPSYEVLKEEEDQVRAEEQDEIERKREAAEKLAAERGLVEDPSTPSKTEQVIETTLQAPDPPTEPNTTEMIESHPTTSHPEKPPEIITPLEPAPTELPESDEQSSPTKDKPLNDEIP